MEQIYRHPAFPQPDNESVILWRYMDVSKFNWLVEFGRLFMPSADRLGDPREGTTPPGEIEWWKRAVENADTAEQRRILEHNRKFLSRMAQALRNHYYVSCWHMNSYENRAMWDCYTAGPKAVAIRTTYAALRVALPRYIEMGVVRYIDYAIARLPTMNMFEYVTHKDSYYGFESEVRAVVLHPAGENINVTHFQENHFESETIPGFLVFAPSVDVKELVQAVVLHPKASADFKAEIVQVCSNAGLPEPELSRSANEAVF
jgi:hypothetical protein